MKMCCYLIVWLKMQLWNWTCLNIGTSALFINRASLTWPPVAFCHICIEHLPPVCVCARDGEERRDDFGSNYLLIIDSDVWSGLLYYSSGTDICDLRLHFHSEWHWQSLLRHPPLTTPLCVWNKERERESRGVCLFCAASLFPSRLPLSICVWNKDRCCLHPGQPDAL